MNFSFREAFRLAESGLLVPQSVVEPEPEVKLVMTDQRKQVALDELKSAAGSSSPAQQPARRDNSGGQARRPPQHSRMFMGMGDAADKPRHNRKRAKRDPRRRKAL